MLKSDNAFAPPPATAASSGSLHSLRSELGNADDQQVLQIVALLDGSSQQAVSSALLERLRPRLATLRPARALGFDRLLFLPMNLLIVPATDWKPGHPAIPRSVITPIAASVLHALGAEAAPILAMIRDRKTDDTATITQAGAILWPRAATLLRELPRPAGWEDTGLRDSCYKQLATAVVAILGMAIDVRALVQGAGGTSPSGAERNLATLLAGLSVETSEIQGMVIRLLMSQIPGAMPLLRQLIANGVRASEKPALRLAMDLGLDAVLLDLEGEQGLTSDLRHSTLSASGAEAARLAAFLLDVEADPEAIRYRSRLNPIRRRLDEICRARLAQGIKTQILRPLEAAGAVVDAGAQKGLETASRDLRALEASGRRFGNAAAYDAALAESSATLRKVCAAGGLTTMRKLRLLEILLGPDAAEAEYRLAQSRAGTER